MENNFKNLITKPFHILTITLLTILLPLSFLLLARLSSYTYLFTSINYPQNPFSIFNLILHTIPSILYFLLSIFSIATLLHGLTGKITLFTESPPEFHRPRLFTAWILLCVVQVCVALGVEGTIAAGIDGHGFEVSEKSLISRVVFFLGLHETMVYWSRSVVKPVVDDTVYGLGRDENWVEKVSLSVCFGLLWWWRLRDEIECLVIVAEVKREMLMGVNLGDLLGWWIYYLTVTIGMVRIVKSLMWVVMVFLFRKLTRVRVNNVESCEHFGAQDKV
ncbi:uncharacterized protein [Euphorbia lathyris]|uniref:uncharacterized protein n=1 Tax=Euphorbia lathyris TaxID=212925 RepID=UPI0033142B22